MTAARVGLAADEQVADVHRRLIEHLLQGGGLAIVEAPPGSGKTFLLLHAAGKAMKAHQRVAIATYTNTQTNDICERLARDGVPLHPVRLFDAARGRPWPGVPWRRKRRSYQPVRASLSARQPSGVSAEPYSFRRLLHREGMAARLERL
jgi:hypothetical protein